MATLSWIQVLRSTAISAAARAIASAARTFRCRRRSRSVGPEATPGSDITDRTSRIGHQESDIRNRTSGRNFPPSVPGYSTCSLRPRGNAMREILIADDDAGLRQSLQLALQAAGYGVRVAAHGGAAFAPPRAQ